MSKVFAPLGATNHFDKERGHEDFYSTDPKALTELLKVFSFNKDTPIWECACGKGHLSEVLKEHGYRVISSDLIDRGYSDTTILDFLKLSDDLHTYNMDILTNPPYKYAKKFVEKAMNIIGENHYAAFLLRIQFLESKSRKELFEKFPPKYIYVSTSRINSYKNDDISSMKNGSALCHAWFIWQKGFSGDPIIKWFN